MPWTAQELRASYEPVDRSQIGIAVLLGGSSLLVVLLAVAAVVAAVNQIAHGH